MSSESYDSIESWVSSRPECVKKLFIEFPPNVIMSIDGQDYFIIGYTEHDELIVTLLDPWGDEKNYENAKAAQTYVCAKHFRVEV